jgi:AcrR family transcriptional regulator
VNSHAAIRKPSRAERNQAVRQRLFDAAARIVGLRGYAEASVARITAEAGVAQGTFYNHFASRQALLDSLLPELGQQMATAIQNRTAAIVPEERRELARFQAFFDYLSENPAFLRILNEAEFAAPEAFRRHIANIAGPYHRILIRARDRGELGPFSDGELEVVVHMLMGARSYLGQRCGPTQAADGAVMSAYARLLAGGLFGGLSGVAPA